MSAKTVDDFEAVRIVADTLQAFKGEDRERILRWAREKLGMAPGALPLPSTVGSGQASGGATASHSEGVGSASPGASDIKSFVAQKSPGSDVHFAATVAYYYQFIAPESARKSSIGKEDLVEACRKVDRKRPGSPAQVLVNAYQDGILDRADKGQYKLNSVGENLVAMVLPGAIESKRSKGQRKKGPRKERPAKRETKRRAVRR
jgi:hypothetical protein